MPNLTIELWKISELSFERVEFNKNVLKKGDPALQGQQVKKSGPAAAPRSNNKHIHEYTNGLRKAYKSLFTSNTDKDFIDPMARGRARVPVKKDENESEDVKMVKEEEEKVFKQEGQPTSTTGSMIMQPPSTETILNMQRIDEDMNLDDTIDSTLEKKSPPKPVS